MFATIKDDDSDLVVSSIDDHIRTKDMWTGGMKPQKIDNCYGLFRKNEYLSDTKGLRIKLDFDSLPMYLAEIRQAQTPAAFKCFDEIIVNATDHAMALLVAPAKHNNKVENINIMFSTTDGTFSVYNDGPSIPVKVNKKYTQEIKSTRDIYDPEIIVSVPLAGTNIMKKEDCIKGGTNGLGAKLPNLHSDWYEVEINDTINKKYYKQRFSNEMRNRELPLVEPCHSGPSFTRITFKLQYKKFGYNIEDNGILSQETLFNIAAWVRYRSYQAASYIGTSVRVTFSTHITAPNTEDCNTVSPALFAKLSHTRIKQEYYGQIVSYECKLISKHPRYKKHPINVVMSILPDYSGRAKIDDSIIINGVIANTGNLLARVKNLILESCESEYKKVKKTDLTDIILFKNVKFTLVGCVPGLDWGSQSKENEKTDAAIVETYDFTKVELAETKRMLLDNILTTDDARKKTKTKNDKYTAPTSRNRSIDNKILFIAEGDSAMAFIKFGLTCKKSKPVLPGGPSTEWCGFISLQGVMPNTEKMTTDHETSTGEIVKIKSANLINNVRYNALMDAIGLDYKKKYTTKEDLKTLNYSKIVLCVDQDVDGIGKIASLVLNWFCGFWPELFTHGILCRFITPLIRVYKSERDPVNFIKEFNYDSDFEKWMNDNNLNEAAMHKLDYKVFYYKGLGSHSEKTEIPRMFEEENFRNSIYTYECDEGALDTMKKYFADDSEFRKQILSTAVRPLTSEEILYLSANKRIKIKSVQLDIDTKTFKLEAIHRQIPHIVDGLNPATRKTLTEALSYFETGDKKKEIKVFLFAANVISNWNYEHGEASICNTVTNMAKTYPGSNLYPVILGVGTYGDRHGTKAADARYIKVKRSPLASKMFPPCDTKLLKYVFNEGERCEPEYFVPIIPLASMESNSIPSEGWKNVMYGRNENDIYTFVDAYINNWTLPIVNLSLHDIAERLHSSDQDIKQEAFNDSFKIYSTGFFPLRPSLRGYTLTYNDIKYYNRILHCFGHYKIVNDLEILITELPLGVKTSTFIDSLKSKSREEYIEEIQEENTPETVYLRIYLKKPIPESFSSNISDKYIEFFNLKESIKSYLNYYNSLEADDDNTTTVIEYDELYHAQILYWAHERKLLYQKRIEREIILVNMKIFIEENIIVYINNGKTNPGYKLQQYKKSSEVDTFLESEGFVKVNTALLFDPGYTSNEDLKRLIQDKNLGTYNYLTNIRDYDKIETEVEKRLERIKKLYDQKEENLLLLQEFPTPCASIWKREIEDFKAALTKCIEKNFA